MIFYMISDEWNLVNNFVLPIKKICYTEARMIAIENVVSAFLVLIPRQIFLVLAANETCASLVVLLV